MDTTLVREKYVKKAPVDVSIAKRRMKESPVDVSIATAGSGEQKRQSFYREFQSGTPFFCAHAVGN